ncbi:hypothetical protein GI582_06625 [Sulfitobacter sp. BDSS02]|nr:hypothetical protein [Sulfitobacter sp. BDSS02]MBR9849130.1 hypothetical protein [Paracoccaceae bacterium]
MTNATLGRDASEFAYIDADTIRKQLQKQGAVTKLKDLNLGPNSVDDKSPLADYRVVTIIEGDTKDGLQAFGLKNDATGDVVVAFKGSQEARDFYDDVAGIGWAQWDEARSQVNSFLQTNWKSGDEVTFAGHSLGGALAQYAIYETAGTYDKRVSDMNLHTQSAPGAEHAIRENNGGALDTARLSGAEMLNLYIDRDLVSKTGGDHLGATSVVANPSLLPGGLYSDHKLGNYTDAAIAGAKAGTPGYYDNEAIQTANPGLYKPLATWIGKLALGGPGTLTNVDLDETWTALSQIPKLAAEVPETKRLITDAMTGAAVEAFRWIGTEGANLFIETGNAGWNAAIDLGEDLGAIGTRGLQVAEQALRHGWDTASEAWSTGTKWTTNQAGKALDSISDAKDAALKFFDKQMGDFAVWAQDSLDSTGAWVADKADKLNKIAGWVVDQSTDFGKDVVNTWKDIGTQANEMADNTLDWLRDTGSDVIDYGADIFGKGRDWLEQAFDDLTDNFRDHSSNPDDWGADFLNRIKDAIDTGFERIGGFWDGLVEWWTGDDTAPVDYAEDVRDRSTTARTEASPLILDLDGDRLELSSISSKGAVFWDIDNDGMREVSGWVKSDDGLLAIDSNNNDEIDDHSELFGTETVDGFTNLAVLDSNFDGVIDKKDDAFEDLVVWRDLNQDGDSDPGELKSLEKSGVVSIKLDAALGTGMIADNRVTHISSYSNDKGQTREISDVWFAYDNVLTRAQGDVPFDPDAFALPHLRGYGMLPDLHTAMARDGELEKLVAELAALSAKEVFDPDQDALGRMDSILYRWAEVSGEDPNGRGYYIDGRQLAFIEAFTDRAFLQGYRSDPAPEAGRTLKTAYENARNVTLTKILAQTDAAVIFKGEPDYEWEPDRFAEPLKLDFKALKKLAKDYEKSGADMAGVWINLILVIDTALDIDTMSRKQAKKLDKVMSKFDGDTGITVDTVLSEIYPAQSLGLNGTSGDDNLRGGGGRDSLSTSSGNDSLFGLRGDDNLNAGEGDDILNGGAGNDLMFGGNGDDIYYYSSGFDTIVDTSGNDRLRIQKKFDLSDMAFLKSQANELDLEIYASGDLIVRIEGFYSTNGAIELLELKDGTIFDLERQAQGIVGTRKGDVLRGDVNEFILSDRIVGLAGKDIIKGGKGSDVLEGQGGNDKLKGGKGDDIQIGGAGKDMLIGGAGVDISRGGMGNDTYKARGKETIIEDGGTDTVMMRKGLTEKDITLYRTALSDDLTIETRKDSILVQGHFTEGGGIEQLKLKNKNGTSKVNIADMAIETWGSDANDYLRGDEGGVARKDVLRGGLGIDRIYGYEDDDTLDGGAGDDYLYGANGNDTLIGGLGNDWMYGGADGDSYVVGVGDDFVQDYDYQGDKTDRIVLDRNFGLGDLDFARMLDGDLLISWKGGSVRIDNAYREAYAIEKLELAGGRVVNLTSQAVVTRGTEDGETIYGNREALGSHDDKIVGLGGDDRLYGQDGNDTLDGGEGDDDMYGGIGADRYLVGSGDDFISDYGTDTDGKDRVVLAPGISAADISYARNSAGDLVISWKSGSARIDNAFSKRYAVELLEFANGSTVDLTSISADTIGTNGGETIYGNRADYGGRDDTIYGLDGDDYLYGFDGADILDGGEGDDQLEGGADGDTYRVGFGHDLIRDYGSGASGEGKDRIEMAPGIAPGDVSYRRTLDGALMIEWAIGSVQINYAFDARYAVETLAFANGTTVDLTKLSLPTIGTSANDYIYGNTEDYGGIDDMLYGLDGDDRLNGYDGNDRLDGGDGDDQMNGGNGDDIYLPGAGENFIQDSGGADTLLLGAGISASDVDYTRTHNGTLLVDWGSGSVSIQSAYDQSSAIEALQFANGSKIALTDVFAPTMGTNANDSLGGNREELGSRDDYLVGRDGNDTLYGYDGADILEGGNGDDTMYGGEGADTYRVGEGDDYISDAAKSDLSDGPDTIRLAAGITQAMVTYQAYSNGDLLISWGTGSARIAYAFDQRYALERLVYDNGVTVDLTTLAVTITGTNGSETIYGNDEEFGTQDDVITGLDGDDAIYGYDGNDTLDGGLGDDKLYGAAGEDEYIVGQGHDLVNDYGDTRDGDDYLSFVAGIDAGDLSFLLVDGQHLRVTWDEGSVQVQNWSTARYQVEKARLADGTIIDLVTQAKTAYTTPANKTFSGDAGNNTLTGEDGNDRLYGYAGADTLEGGLGNDTLQGGDGGDTYKVGDGDDEITDYGSSGSAADVIQLKSGINPGDVSFSRDSSGTLLLDWKGGSVAIKNAFSKNYAVETLRYGNGVTQDLKTISVATIGTGGNDNLRGNRETLGSRNDTLRGFDGDDQLYGYDGNDILDGGLGDDNLYGAEGGDIYLVGDGDDYISDRGTTGDSDDEVRLKNGINPGDVTMRLQNGDIWIGWDDGSVTIDNGFDSSYAVEKLRYGNGTVVDLTSLALETHGTTADDTLYGNRGDFGSRNDLLVGLDGDDTMYGYDGNDRFSGGLGDDSMYGAEGGDTYYVGDGHDLIWDYGQTGDPKDVIRMKSGVSASDVSYSRSSGGNLVAEWADGSFTIQNAFRSTYAVEQLIYSDGATVDLTKIAAPTYGTNANDTVSGNNGDIGSKTDVIYGLDGDDRLYGYDGDDTLIGGFGNDTMYGAAGTDTYLVGDGHDTISDYGDAADKADVIKLKSGISASDVSYTLTSRSELIIDWDSGSVTIQYAFNKRYAIETLQFADGTKVDLTSINAELRGTGGNETLNGNRADLGSINDRMFGLDGDDRLYGYDGNDWMDGGLGDDFLYGSTGDDTYVASEGSDTFDDSRSDSLDTILFNSVSSVDELSFARSGTYDLSISWAQGDILLKNHYYSDEYAFERLMFDDGSWTVLSV